VAAITRGRRNFKTLFLAHRTVAQQRQLAVQDFTLRTLTVMAAVVAVLIRQIRILLAAPAVQFQLCSALPTPLLLEQLAAATALMACRILVAGHPAAPAAAVIALALAARAATAVFRAVVAAVVAAA
jgi:hypothetical protein